MIVELDCEWFAGATDCNMLYEPPEIITVNQQLKIIATMNNEYGERIARKTLLWQCNCMDFSPEEIFKRITGDQREQPDVKLEVYGNVRFPSDYSSVNIVMSENMKKVFEELKSRYNIKKIEEVIK